MEYIQLRYFAEVARLQSFSKAAETLHISQPSLSRAIKGMEDELGVVLFDRTTRYLRLTDDGEIVLRHAAAALSMSRDLLSTLNEGRELQRGELLLGLPPVIGASFFCGDYRRLSVRIPRNPAAAGRGRRQDRGTAAERIQA
ncbi:LysR family transcriptional regulator [Cohnella ginsengisoli]|uniref:LysR family transcriptional regulator n=1 Tax=Cohnella ginsengisoli TaxID=425004 RepID=A0A9X4QPR6_9BACL|nr:LysR family transcriptional regulator [Cohnella ginsengisoli]MDG0793806.1 LysR family transcriptional regulator [Cohnella ginsengisoli]